MNNRLALSIYIPNTKLPISASRGINKSNMSTTLTLRQRFVEIGGVWDDEWEALSQIAPKYLEGYINIQQAARSKQRLSKKVQELVFLSVAASCTHIHLPAIRAHVTAALQAGATKDEVFEAIGLSYLLGVHTLTLGVPILFELMEELDISQENYKMDANREAIKQDFINQRGFWPETFTVLLNMDPDFFQSYTEFSSFSYSTSKALEPKVRELIVCAIDSATTHLYARGTKIHMKNALNLGATPDEIIEMLEITSLMGIHGVTHASPLLAGEKGP
jgi:alkylhydroperoxidase/carboxymuconolactone decarboxylase family protein YurZ